MRYLLLSVLVVCMIGVLVIPSAFAEDWYYYVDPVPSWAPSYTENVVDFSINAWERTNPNLKFIEITSPDRADIVIQWVKEFGTGTAGQGFDGGDTGSGGTGGGGGGNERYNTTMASGGSGIVVVRYAV